MKGFFGAQDTEQLKNYKYFHRGMFDQPKNYTFIVILLSSFYLILFLI